MGKALIMNMVWIMVLLLAAIVEADTPPGIANNPSHARCLIKRYKMCYNLEHVCPKFCPDSCTVECVSCKPICSGGSTSSPEVSNPPPDNDSSGKGAPPPKDDGKGDGGKGAPPPKDDDGGKGDGGKGAPPPKDDGKGDGGKEIPPPKDDDGGKGDGGKGVSPPKDDGKRDGGKGAPPPKDDDGKGDGGKGAPPPKDDGKGDGGKGAPPPKHDDDGKGDGGKGAPPSKDNDSGKGAPPPENDDGKPQPPSKGAPPPKNDDNGDGKSPPSKGEPPLPPPVVPVTPSPSTPTTPPPSAPLSPPAPSTQPPTPETPLPTPSPSPPTSAPPPSPTATPNTPPTPVPQIQTPPPSSFVPVTPSPPIPTPTPTEPPPSTPLSPPPSPGDSSDAAAGRRKRCKNRDYPQCYNVEHVCPTSCPHTCEIDCVTCKPVCKCDMPGAVCQDPRFIGGDGITFYFHGKKDKDFCLVTEPNFQINAHFIGKRNKNINRDFTWVQSIAILFGDHQLFVGAKKTATWNDAVDRFSLAFDGEPILLSATEQSTWRSSALPTTTITRDSDTNSVIIKIDGLFKISAKVVPITQHESRVHNYGITEDDCFAHLELGFKFFSLSGNVNGVLGQTYGDNYVSRVKMGVSTPVLGGEREFAVSNIFAPDCSVSQFRAGKLLPENYHVSALELPSMKCGSGIDGTGVVCKK